MSTYDEANKLWYAVDQQPKSDFKNWSAQQILDKLSSHGRKVAQINDDTRIELTYHEIHLYAIRVAQNLLKRGFKPRDVLGFLTDHSDYLVPIVVAAACLACPMAPLHPTLSKDEIVRFFMKSKPTVAFCDVSACGQLNEALKELPFSVKVFTFGGGLVDGFEPVVNLLEETGEEDDFVPITFDAEVEIGSILCSSGSTGPSKSIRVPFCRTIALNPDLTYDSATISYCPDSIYWGVGFKPICDSIESGETRIITTKPFTPETPLQLIDKYKVTILSIATFDLIACIKTDLIRNVNLSSVKLIQFYGSKLANDLVAEVYRNFPNAALLSLYGMTEIGTVSAATYNSNKNDGGAVLLDGCIAKIVDKDRNRCGLNKSGELCLKKRVPFGGYIDAPEENASAIDDDGFYRTGDIAYFDDNGRLFLQDRIKNTLTLFYFDSTLLPVELEDCLINIPGVRDVCVVGVPIASGAALPAAVVVPKPNSNLTKCEVFDKIKENFPKRSWLRAGVYFVDKIPKTTNGKVLRREITKTTAQMFEAIKQSDSDIQSYVADIPDAFRKLI